MTRESIEPSGTEPSETDPSTPQTKAEALAVFRRFPTAVVVFLGLLIAVGVGVAVAHLGKIPVAQCGAREMSPGDICTLRRGRRTVGTTDWTFQERLDWNRYENLSLAAAGSVVGVLAAVMIIAVLIRWRRDVAVVATVVGDREPMASYGQATGVLTAVFTLGAAIVGGIGALLAVRGFGGKGSPTASLVMAAIALVVMLGLLWLGRPRGCTYVAAYPENVRVVTGSKVHDLAWSDLQYGTTLDKDPATTLAWVGRKDELAVSDADFFATMRGRINAAVGAVVSERMNSGEVLDFGSVKVTGPTVQIGKRKTVAATDLGSVSATKDKNNSVHLDFRDQQGTVLASTPAREVGNVDVLFDLLGRRFGVRLPNG